MEEQIQQIENQLGFITLEINSAETEQERQSIEDRYSNEVINLVQQLEQLKNN
jgi:hypothetical protein